MMTPRDLSKCAVRQAKCAFISLPDGGIANDPVLLRLEQNRCWLSLADSDIGLWAQGLVYHSGPDVTIGEVDVAPVQIQIQGPVLEAGRSLGLEVIGPCHIRRIEGAPWRSGPTCLSASRSRDRRSAPTSATR